MGILTALKPLAAWIPLLLLKLRQQLSAIGDAAIAQTVHTREVII